MKDNQDNKVYLVKKGGMLEEKIRPELSAIFKKGEKIAVKLHMGEPGNKFFLKPEFTKRVVGMLTEIGAQPFLFDSPVSYNSPRNNPAGYLKAVAEHGYSEDNMGCPIIVSGEFITVKTGSMDFEVCKDLVNADGVLVLSHVKGHLCCGFGGAIKNLGMGALTKKTKQDIHNGGKPAYKGGCTMCRECEKHCPTDNIRYADNRPYFDKNWCCGCSNCAIFCKFNAIKPKIDTFDNLLALGAASALKRFKKAYFINVLMDFAKTCDCNPKAEHSGLEDIGTIFGKNIVPVEKAALDLINKKAGMDFFEGIHHKSPLMHIQAMSHFMKEGMQYELAG